MTKPHDGDRIHVGDIQQSQGVAIGRNAHAEVHGVILAGEHSEIDRHLVAATLKELRAAIREAGLPEEVALPAETAAGNALLEGIKDEDIRPDLLIGHLKEVANTLDDANVAIEKGSKLYDSVLKLAPAVAPLVIGGARAVGTWFGVAVPS